MSRTRNWTPVENGDVYCSPACGCKCKRVDYDNAVAASETFTQTIGDGWQHKVWENCGWHFSASKGCMEVHKTDTGYTAYFNSIRQHVCSASTAEAAIQGAIDAALMTVDILLEDCNFITTGE